MPQPAAGKLKLRFYSPYRVVELINNVAVRLALPPQARLHDVFHVGLLKKFHGEPPQEPPALRHVRHGAIIPEPKRAVKTRLARGVRLPLEEGRDIMYGRGTPGVAGCATCAARQSARIA